MNKQDGCRLVDEYAGASYKTAPRNTPAKNAFSAKYTQCGIRGASGLSDQSFESDMPQEFATEEDFGGKEWEGGEQVKKGAMGYKCLESEE